MISTGALRDVTSQFIAKCLASADGRSRIEPVLSLLGFDDCTVQFTASREAKRPALESLIRTSGGVRSLGIAEDQIPRFVSGIEEFRVLPTNKTSATKNDNAMLQFLSELSHSVNADLADVVWFLKKAGIANGIAQVLATNAWVAVDALSNGQLLLLSMVARMAAVVEANSLVVIDEPETGLHPSWQSDFIPLLKKTLPETLGCHFIIATHSPHIVSDGSDVLVPGAKWGTFEQFEDPFEGRSVENLLYRVFETRVSGNKAVDDDLVRVLRFVSKVEPSPSRSTVLESVNRLQRVSGPDTTELNEMLTQAERILGDLR